MAHYEDEGFGTSTYKILFLGPSNSGKTSLIQSYIEKRPVLNHPKTNNVLCAVKTFPKNKCKLHLVDVEGKLSKVDFTDSQLIQRDALYKGTKVVVITFDLSNSEAFELLSDYIELVKKKIPNVPVVLVGNKSDCNLQITAQQIEDFVQTKKIEKCIHTSAKCYSNVQELFSYLIDVLNIKQPEEETKTQLSTHLSRKRALLIEKLQGYISRIHSYRDAQGQINFAHGFWFLGPFFTRESRAFNRLINYNIAVSLLDALQKNYSESFETIFSKVGNIKRTYLDVFNARNDPDYVERGIWGELRSIIKLAGEPESAATETTSLMLSDL